MKGPVKVLIAEDSAIFAEVLRETIDPEPDMEVVGISQNGEEAISACAELQPDLVLMDIRMPKLDGLSATERIMADCPTPILVVTSDPYHGGVDMSFRALSAGALDLMAKPSSLPWPEPDRETFLRKIRLLAQIPVVRHQRAVHRRKRVSYHGPQKDSGEPSPVVGIVASTGGPRALGSLLGELPSSFPAPIFIVQHIIPGFSAHLAKWLNTVSDLEVVEAEHRAIARAGRVYLAPADRHLKVEKNLRIALVDDGPVSGHRPSGDVLLESLARHAEGGVLGVVLSGMGSDGTTGLAAVQRGGGTTFVQDRSSSVVYGMPQSAIDIGVVDHVVQLDKMARRLVRQVDKLRAKRA